MSEKGKNDSTSTIASPLLGAPLGSINNQKLAYEIKRTICISVRFSVYVVHTYALAKQLTTINLGYRHIRTTYSLLDLWLTSSALSPKTLETECKSSSLQNPLHLIPNRYPHITNYESPRTPQAQMSKYNTQVFMTKSRSKANVLACSKLTRYVHAALPTERGDLQLPVKYAIQKYAS